MSAIDEVKSRLNIEDVIGEYVQLKRTGRSWKGLSPFKPEKTPSFTVTPEKNIWKDFSSGKGGSIFDFIMEVEGLDFKGSLELLARKAGVDLDEYRNTPNRRGPNKARLYELLELAAKFYQAHLKENKTALAYVIKERGFKKETVVSWRLGYSPNSGSALVNFAKSKGFSAQEIKQAGLSSQGYRNELKDMFRGRLMIPLQDAQGQVVGFTARTLSNDSKVPKYINTPQTVLYDKSRHVYGLHLAKEAIRVNNYVVIVEGNLDVIASHQAGIKETVATAGTAMTEYHLKAVSRFTDDVRLGFDVDEAGLAATERAIPLASKARVSLSIIPIESGKDPDELIKKDPKLWQEAINKNVYALDWLIERYKKLLDLSGAQGKRQFSDVLLPVVNRLSDPVEQDHYLNTLAKILDVSRGALTQKLQTTSKEAPVIRKKPIKVSSGTLSKSALEYQKVQEKLLSLLLMRPSLRSSISLINDAMLIGEPAKTLLKYLKTNPKAKPSEIKMKSIEDYVKIEELLYEELYHGLESSELQLEAERLQADLVTKFIKNEKAKLAEAQRQTTAEASLRVLQEKDKQLNILLNQVKGVS